MAKNNGIPSESGVTDAQKGEIGQEALKQC